MTSSPPPTATAAPSDTELVRASLAGDRRAFAAVVARYQRLVCSVAFAATGDLARSEDVAQETFVAAWSGLSALEDPSRLKAWLCGVARNLVGRHHRAARAEPSHGAAPIDGALDLPDEAAGPPARLIAAEEQALLWRALEGIPPRYREPLVLFYRERRSVAEVAAALELGEDLVRQRLTRGRRLLAREVRAFVEETLEGSGPGRAFTLAVLAAIPAGTPGTAAAASTPAAVRAFEAASSALPAAAAAGLATGALSVRTLLAQTGGPGERAAVLRAVATLAGVLVAASLALAGLVGLGRAAPGAALGSGIAAQLVVLGFASWYVVWLSALLSTLRDPSRRLRPPTRTRATLLGVPLLHVMWETPPPGTPPAFAWVAVGDRAVGLLFAMGSMAAAPIAVGSVAVGGVAVGVVSLGAIPIGTVAIGFLAMGAASVGVVAYAGASALGLLRAEATGFALSAGEALGDPAFGAVPRLAGALTHGADWALAAVIVAIGLLPLALYAFHLRRRLRG